MGRARAAARLTEQLRTQAPPAFRGRGDQDRVITPAAVARTAAYLPGHTALTSRVYARPAHGIDAAEIADVRSFLAARVVAGPIPRVDNRPPPPPVR